MYVEKVPKTLPERPNFLFVYKRHYLSLYALRKIVIMCKKNNFKKLNKKIGGGAAFPWQEMQIFLKRTTSDISFIFLTFEVLFVVKCFEMSTILFSSLCSVLWKVAVLQRTRRKNVSIRWFFKIVPRRTLNRKYTQTFPGFKKFQVYWPSWNINIFILILLQKLLCTVMCNSE